MHLPKHRWVFSFVALLLLFPLSSASAADVPGIHQQDSSKKRIEREKAFLLRSSDDLARSLAYVGETIALLNGQVEGAAIREPESKAKERRGLLEWYRNYAESLRGMAAEFDLEVNNYYARQPTGGWIDRHEEWATSIRRLAAELGGMMQTLEAEKKRLEVRMKMLNAAVLERRVLVDKDGLELVRELWPAYRPDDRREVKYKDLTDAEVFYLRNSLGSLGEQMKYFESLSGLGKYEENWLVMKIEEFMSLQKLARGIGNEEPVRLVSVVRNTITTYETDRALLKGISDDIDTRIRGITRTGTLRRLDRQEELSRYYENMKSRYERHREWLGTEIGSYQADLIELGKEL